MKRFQLLLFSFLIFTACEEERSENEPYQYIAYYGKSLRVCAEGTINFNNSVDDTIGGNWKIDAVDTFTESNIGPQIGEGLFKGKIHNGKFSIDLNPNWRDNNINLIGGFQDDKFSGGYWTWSTFAGVSSSGSFKLTREWKIVTKLDVLNAGWKYLLVLLGFYAVYNHNHHCGSGSASFGGLHFSNFLNIHHLISVDLPYCGSWRQWQYQISSWWPHWVIKLIQDAF